MVVNKTMRIQQSEEPTAITKSVISKTYPAVGEEMSVKNDDGCLASAGNKNITYFTSCLTLIGC